MLKPSPDRKRSADDFLEPSDARGLTRQHVAQAAGFVAVIIAALSLIGWWAELPVAVHWAVKPLAALYLVGVGLAVTHSGKNSRFAFTIGLAVAALAALDLGLNLLGVELGIERWLVPGAAVSKLGTASFRITSAAALALALAGGSLALSCFERHHLAATMLSGIAGAFAMFGLVSRLSGIDTLYDEMSYRVPPLATAIGLLCVTGGIILRIGTMPEFREPQPLWRLLIMLGCAIIAPLLLFGAYAGFRIADTQFDQVRNNLTSEAQVLSAGVDREIIGEIERSQALAASPSLRHGDFAEFRRQAEASLALRQSGNIVLVDRSMQQLVNSAVPFGKPLPKTPIPEGERAFATGKPQVTDLFLAPIVQQLVVAIIVPVDIDGETRYALGRSPDQNALARVVAANGLPTGWRALVSDATHHIIARSELDASIGQALPPSQWHRAGPDGVFEFIDAEGRSSLEAHVRSELTGWQTAVWAPMGLLEAPVQTLWRALGAMALLAFILVAALALWLGRVIAGSVGHAARAAIGSEENGLPRPTPVVEVNTLMAELRETTALLRESEATFRAMFDVSSVGKIEVEPESGRFLRANAAMCNFVGYSEAELVARTVYDITHPDDLDIDREPLRHTVGGELAGFDMEKRYIRKGGNVVWARVTVNAIHVPGRPLRNTGVILDITERKEREEREHLLMREINHRAKNMLSVVDAIAHQTATKNPEDFMERFSERIQALSANQDLLVRTQWHGVEIEDLVRAQLAPFADLIGPRIVMHGRRLRLNTASAQAIGLALHELATNAGKYGALSTGTGRVDIGWGTDGESFVMGWTEREGRPVSTPQRSGFGTVVMKAMAERSVDGTVDLGYASSGVTWRLTCPAANALEPHDHPR
jgi:PAS domain S-box-containing protein